MERVNVGFIGCGNISEQYLRVSPSFPILNVVACADLVRSQAEARALQFGIEALSPEALLASPEIDIVVNLTIPAAHAEVSLAAIEAGKHVYSEKPLATNLEDARRILRAAASANVRVACAPDTFLGGGYQTCRKLIDDGWIGEPVAATAFMTSRGPEAWHPNPAFFYQAGGGPLFDMGPYYLTALVNLLGPVSRVTGSARKSFEERIATSEARFGEHLPVDVATHVAGLLDFASGPVATLITSFDVWHASLPRVEIYGSEGTLSAPDPNIFGGPVLIRRGNAASWSEVPHTHYVPEGRGIGVADLAYAIRYERPHRASGELAYHVLELMHGIVEASERGRHLPIESKCPRPRALPMGLLPGMLDE